MVLNSIYYDILVLSSQNQTLRREIMLHAQRMKSFLSGLMQRAWKRQ